VFVDWLTDITWEINGLRAQVKPISDLITSFERLGITTQLPVITYDSGNMMLATRLWWTLKLAGHPCVSVLDGGYAAFLARGGTTQYDSECPLKMLAEWDPQLLARPQPYLLASYEDVLAAIDQPDVQIIDARSVEHYRGENTRAARAGRIPTALNVPYKCLLQESGTTPYEHMTFKPAESIRQIFTQCGVDCSRPSIVYCHGGVSSTVVLFALYDLGNTKVRNYDGSWHEWGNRIDAPIVTGSPCTSV
jgi:thiosulfate/3-mercaptopyruvate sulfurtransferase